MKCILIIDADSRRSLVLKRILESEPFEMHIAANLREAMELFLSKVFDLVLLDAGLQKIKKFDIAKWFTYHRGTARVVLMSDKQDTSMDLSAPVSASVARVIQRPIDPLRLIAILKQLLTDIGFSGTITKIELQDYIQMICLSNGDKTILVLHGDQRGRIDIRGGKIVNALQGNLKGQNALYRILSWKHGNFSDAKQNDACPITIQEDYRKLLMEAAKYQDELAEVVPKEGSSQKQSVDNRKQTDPMRINEVQALPEPLLDKQPIPTGSVTKKRILKEQTLNPSTREEALGNHTVDWAVAPAVKEKPIDSRKRSPKRGYYVWSIGAGLVLFIILAVFWGIQKYRDHLNSAASAASLARNTTSQNMEDRSSPTPTSKGYQGYSSLRKQLLFKIHGSNTIGAELMPALAKEFLATRFKATDITTQQVSGTSDIQISGIIDQTMATIEIEALGSGTGFKDMQADKCDIAMSSRPIKEEESVALAGFGEMTGSGNEHILGMDGIAIIVHPANPVNQLSITQLADIFSEKAVDWKVVGGLAGPIHIYARDDNSGTYDTFKQMILPKGSLTENAKRFDNNMALADAVVQDPNGIGFVGLPYIRNSKAIAVADQGATAVFPNFFTVGTEDYPLSRRLFLYIPANPKNSGVRDFVEFALSPAGQEIVKKIGFVDMDIKSFEFQPNAEYVFQDRAVGKRYAELTKAAQRLSVNFRFHKDDSRLDNRALRDLERMVHFLKNRMDKKIILIGFTDSTGDYAYNRKLALERANRVAKEFTARGIRIEEIFSAGSELNVASNATPSGRDKNRRVEVWIH